MQKVLDVHIGQVKIAKDGEILKAILGSCVGIGIIWREKRLCGLAHCLLPQSPTNTFQIGGRFVNQAMRSLIALMRIRPHDLKGPAVIIVGGSNITAPSGADHSKLIGAHNFRKAIEEAKLNDLNLIYTEAGDDEGRKIIIDCANFSYKTERIPRISGSTQG